jgi:archaemetzincin
VVRQPTRIHPWGRIAVAALAPFSLLCLGALGQRLAPSHAWLRPLLGAADARIAPRSHFTPAARARRADTFRERRSENGFTRLQEPKKGDWLAAVGEDGQTADEYRRHCKNRKGASRHTIHLQLLGELPDGARQLLLPALREYVAIYFDVDVEILGPAKRLLEWRVDRADQDNANFITDVLAARVPPNSLALVGLTAADIFAGDARFVFGYGLLGERAAVISAHRFLGDPPRLLERTLKLASHEIGHSLGLKHCVFYECVMNGANALTDMDRVPLHVCPICCAKLEDNVGFDRATRYRRLATFYRKHQLHEAAVFAEARSRE